LLLAQAATRPFAQEQKSGFFLPQNPAAAAYVLGRLSNPELIAAPRGEFVYVALLQRAGLDRKYRLEALAGLAKIRKTDNLTELLGALAELDKKGENSADVLRDLLPILLQSTAAELTAKRETLAKLVEQSQVSFTRQIAYAAMITADGSLDGVWSKSNPEQRADLILSIPLVADSNLRAMAYPKVEPLLHQPDPPELRRAAITAIVAIPGHDSETFKTLAALVQEGTERLVAIAGLQRIPQKLWPKETAVSMLNRLVEYLQTVSTDERTGSDFTSAVQFATDLASFLPEEQARNVAKTLRGLGPAVIVLRAVYEQLRYDKQLIVVEAGKLVAVTLENLDAMPHNLVILAPGSLEEIGTAAEKMPPDADAKGRFYIPESPKVLHATKLVAPGQKNQMSFTAPVEPGDYPYVCTFPGHWRRMSGVMAVVKDVDAYLASHAEAEKPKITEWKWEDLAPEAPKSAFGRDLEAGKKMFTQLACAQCHKLGKEGYSYGPELTGVLARYKNDRAAVLQQILEPSKVIEDRYRNVNFVLKGGDEPVAGMVVKEDQESVTIQTGPADSLVRKLNKAEILQRQPQPSSLMPVGLLNTLSKEQILDLLGFVLSGGENEAHIHQH